MLRRREIDGLRAVAVAPVVLWHAGVNAVSGGFVGVDVFFVVGGYLITGLIVSEREAGTFTLARFYERRARNILPALLLVVACFVPLAWLWAPIGLLNGYGRSLAAVTAHSSPTTSSWDRAAATSSPSARKSRCCTPGASQSRSSTTSSFLSCC